MRRPWPTRGCCAMKYYSNTECTFFLAASSNCNYLPVWNENVSEYSFCLSLAVLTPTVFDEKKLKILVIFGLEPA
jgi:hypothetical protein